MKRLIFLTLLLCAGLDLRAQDCEQLSGMDSLYFCDVYKPYPEPQGVTYTKPPKGFEAVYISHLGRHGSRWQSTEENYERVLRVFESAHKEGGLTPQGERLLSDLRVMTNHAKGHGGELSPLGVMQHRGIARRMYGNFPRLFLRSGCRVDARSTSVLRCVLSMANFCTELQKCCACSVDYLTSASNDYYLQAHLVYPPLSDEVKATAKEASRYFRVDTRAVISRFFKDGSFPEKMDRTKFTDYLFGLVAGVRSARPDGISDIDYVFTAQEKCLLSQKLNAKRYFMAGPSEGASTEILRTLVPVLENIVTTADKALAGEGEDVTLRFVHDIQILPFPALIGLQEGSYSTSDYRTLSLHWRSSALSPMAANYQLIFYRNSQGEVLVKVLYNEREMKFLEGTLEARNSFYYPWKELRSMWCRRIDELKQ